MKKFSLTLILTFLAFSVFAENWTLGVMEFSFRQNQKRAESFEKAAQVLPQLIIEQFSGENLRTVPEIEMLDRRLNELQTERLSLFLQLSKEYKERDSLILTSSSPKAFEKSLNIQIKKIQEIEQKIEENLSKTELEKSDVLPAKNDSTFPFQLPFKFFRRDEKNTLVTENVVLYKNDSTALFKPSEVALESGFSSWNFENEVLAEKINGLITGEITCYGDYCSVTVSLRVYPGCKVFGTVTEVGRISDLLPIASSIARNLDSKVANALPVLIEFDIEPKEAGRNAKIMVDGVVSSDNKIIKDSGVHRISIDSEGYENLSFNYAFSAENRFFVRANLVPKIHGIARIRLKKYQDGVFQTYARLADEVSKDEPFAKIEVNGKSVLGVFSAPQGEEGSSSDSMAFFQIPASRAFDGANLVVNAKPFDRAAYIDKRRRRMYTAYTALICSLPFTFYNLGEFTAENTAFAQGRGDRERLQNLQRRSTVCAGISAACGIWAMVELVRYLWAADKVLPEKAKIDKKAVFEPKITENEIVIDNGETSIE